MVVVILWLCYTVIVACVFISPGNITWRRFNGKAFIYVKIDFREGETMSLWTEVSRYQRPLAYPPYILLLPWNFLTVASSLNLRKTMKMTFLENNVGLGGFYLKAWEVNAWRTQEKPVYYHQHHIPAELCKYLLLLRRNLHWKSQSLLRIIPFSNVAWRA